MIDRAGLTGPDGPTHHGVYDVGYMRLFPNMVVMAPGYAEELPMMLKTALEHDHPCSLRYPKASAMQRSGPIAPIEIGTSETIREGRDGTIVAFGAMLENAIAAAKILEDEMDIEVINARFAKPIDQEMVRRTVSESPFVITLEENAVMGGFGSAFLESAASQRLDTRRVQTIGLPDRFVEHGDRNDLLHDCGLSPQAIAERCRLEAPQASKV